MRRGLGVVGAASAATHRAIRDNRLQPNRIPIRVLANAPYQPRANRVHDDIARHGTQIVRMAQGTIMESSPPDGAQRFMSLPQYPRTAPLADAYAARQVRPLRKLHQSVPVIRASGPKPADAPRATPRRMRVAMRLRAQSASPRNARIAHALRTSPDKSARRQSFCPCVVRHVPGACVTMRRIGIWKDRISSRSVAAEAAPTSGDFSWVNSPSRR